MDRVPLPPRLPGIPALRPLAAAPPIAWVPELPSVAPKSHPGLTGQKALELLAFQGSPPAAITAKLQNLPQSVQSQLQSMMEGTGPSELPPGNAVDAAKDFAAILFGYMFSEMRPKEDEEGSLLGGGDSEMFMDFFDQAMGRQFVESGNLPLVDMLVKQLSRPQED